MAETGQSAPKLYSPRLLGLSTSLAQFPYLDHLPYKSELRSRTCGSTIELALDADAHGTISRIGMRVSACAVGQSSAAVLAQAIEGRAIGDVQNELAAIESWLSGTGTLPTWPGFDALEPALPYAGRHEALLLPWRAAVKALSTPAICG